MISRLYANRNHSREAITCKLGTIVASTVLALIIVCKTDALDLVPYASVVFGYPRTAGATLLTISALQFRWLWTGRDPLSFVEVGSYVLQFALWAAMLIFLLFDSRLDPAAISGVGTVACLAWWAFVCGALRGYRDAVVG